MLTYCPDIFGEQVVRLQILCFIYKEPAADWLEYLFPRSATPVTAKQIFAEFNKALLAQDVLSAHWSGRKLKSAGSWKAPRPTESMGLFGWQIGECCLGFASGMFKYDISYLSSFGSNTSLTSLTIVGMYLSAAPWTQTTTTVGQKKFQFRATLNQVPS